MVYLTGYFGANNTGDEAIASVVSNYMKDLEPVVTGGKFEHQSNAVIVAGGEYDSWMIAGATSSLYATGIGLVRDMVGPQRQAELSKFKQLWVRTHMDYRVAKSWGLNPLQGIDSAVLMEPTAEGFKDRDIIIPDWRQEWVNNIDFSQYNNPVALPLHPYDRLTQNQIEQHEIYNNPQLYLNCLVGAKRIITWGRLHCQILGYVAGCSVIDLAPNIKGVAWHEMKDKYSLEEMRRMANYMLFSVKEDITNS